MATDRLRHGSSGERKGSPRCAHAEGICLGKSTLTLTLTLTKTKTENKEGNDNQTSYDNVNDNVNRSRSWPAVEPAHARDSLAKGAFAKASVPFFLSYPSIFIPYTYILLQIWWRIPLHKNFF